MVALSSRGIFHDAFCHRWHLSLKEEWWLYGKSHLLVYTDAHQQQHQSFLTRTGSSRQRRVVPPEWYYEAAGGRYSSSFLMASFFMVTRRWCAAYHSSCATSVSQWIMLLVPTTMMQHCTVLFDFEMSPCQSSKAERGRPKADRAKQSIHRHFLHSNQCSWNVWFCNQKVIWQMFAFRKHDAMCRKRHFVTIMHPDHSRHSSSFTFQMGFLLFLCFLIET